MNVNCKLQKIYFYFQQLLLVSWFVIYIWAVFVFFLFDGDDGKKKTEAERCRWSLIWQLLMKVKFTIYASHNYKYRIFYITLYGFDDDDFVLSFFINALFP
jgi:hypothetical protein